MRTSKDEYKLPDGTIAALSQDQAPPEGAVVWNGYDYRNQYWVREGARDTRTLEELRAAVENKKSKVCNGCGYAIDQEGFCTAPLSVAD